MGVGWPIVAILLCQRAADGLVGGDQFSCYRCNNTYRPRESYDLFLVTMVEADARAMCSLTTVQCQTGVASCTFGQVQLDKKRPITYSGCTRQAVDEAKGPFSCHQESYRFPRTGRLLRTNFCLCSSSLCNGKVFQYFSLNPQHYPWKIGERTEKSVNSTRKVDEENLGDVWKVAEEALNNSPRAQKWTKMLWTLSTFYIIFTITRHTHG